MMSVQDEMFEQSAEGGVALAGVGLFARAAHVQDHTRVRQVFGDVDGALELVHGLDAAHALHFADGKRERAFAGGAEIAAVGGMEGIEREPMRVQGLGHGLDFGANRGGAGPAPAMTSAAASHGAWSRRRHAAQDGVGSWRGPPRRPVGHAWKHGPRPMPENCGRCPTWP